MEYHVKYNVHIYIYMNQCIYIHLRDNIHMCVYIYIYRCGTLEMYKDVGDSLYHLGLGYTLWLLNVGGMTVYIVYIYIYT